VKDPERYSGNAGETVTTVSPTRETSRRALIVRAARKRENARELEQLEIARAFAESDLVQHHCGNEKEDRGNFE
jgi:hypothetical protein